MPVITAKDWGVFLEDNPDAHLLQTAEWGVLKEKFDWKVVRIKVGNIGAQILVRRFLPGVKLVYIPKGPVGVCWDNLGSDRGMWNNLFIEIDAICRKENAFMLKVEPDTWEVAEKFSVDGTLTHINSITVPDGFLQSTHCIQPQRTIVIDLKDDDDRILARMKQKTRYNIGLARRKNIFIHPSADVNVFFRLMKETSARDDFFVHDQSYYQTAYELFHPSGNCELLVADFQNEAIAALMVFSSGNRAWYLYGGSSNVHRELMPSYLLQWEALLWAKRRGCIEYDLWGVPDENLVVLEDQCTQRSDGLWGVYRFKRGFGGELRRAAGPWERVYNPLAYYLYRWWIKRKILLK